MPDLNPEHVKLIVLDVDGVLSDGLIHYDNHGTETKTFHARDGLGLRVWRKLGFEVAIITGRASMTVQHRMTELGVEYVFQGVQDKRAAFRAVLEDLSLNASQAAVVGDDLPDLPMLRLAGYPIAVADAVHEVQATAAYVTHCNGGRGAVREAVEHLLKQKGRWDEALAFFD